MSIFIDTLKGQKSKTTPVWLMRQAGRHLPEYVNIRKRFGDLMDMFFDPTTILEISMQPIKRYNMDACIVFSDILITPFASGSDVKFIEGEGPIVKFNENVNYNHKITYPIATGIKKIKKNTNTPLIGFAGGVWTVLFYCLYEKSDRKKIKPDDILKKTPQIDNLIEKMTQATIQHAEMQIDC
jgi:uroporphyrinogen decarboxylase